MAVSAWCLGWCAAGRLRYMPGFGIFGSAVRQLVFDINDSGDTLPGRGNGMSQGLQPAAKWPNTAAGSTARTGVRS